MPKDKKPEYAGTAIACGIVEIPTEWITKAPTENYSARAVVLCDETAKAVVRIGDTPVTCTIKLVVTRDGVGNEELAAIATVADKQKQTKKDRDTAADEAMEKKNRLMFELGSTSNERAMLGTFQNIGKIAEAAKVIDSLRK